MKTYYISKPDGSQLGPLSITSLAKLRMHGQIPNDSLIWSEGMNEWKPIEEVLPSSYMPKSSWNLINVISHSLRPYASFSGRASRTEFWLFQLSVYMLYGILIGLGILLESSETAALAVAFIIIGSCSFILLLPSIAILVRRLHDIGLTGWFILLGLIPYVGGIILLVMTLLPSQQANRYGVGADLAPFK